MREKKPISELVIVIDMQNDFVDGVLGSPACQAVVPRQVDFLKAVECPIWFTLDTHPEDYASDPENVHLPVPHCITGTHGHELIEAMQPFAGRPDSVLIEKPTFGSTRLERMVSTMPALEKITLFGVDTDICVVSNAFLIKAARPDIQIVVKKDLCAGSSPENHEAALKVMRSCHCDIE